MYIHKHNNKTLLHTFLFLKSCDTYNLCNVTAHGGKKENKHNRIIG